MNAVSEYDVRFDLFFAVRQFMSAEEIRQLADEVLETLDKHSLENENEVFAGILDVADAAGDAPLYEKIMFRRDPDRKNGSLIAAAKARKKNSIANRWLSSFFLNVSSSFHFLSSS